MLALKLHITTFQAWSLHITDPHYIYLHEKTIVTPFLIISQLYNQ
jgi:hypothetical protein